MFECTLTIINFPFRFVYITQLIPSSIEMAYLFRPSLINSAKYLCVGFIIVIWECWKCTFVTFDYVLCVFLPLHLMTKIMNILITIQLRSVVGFKFDCLFVHFVTTKWIEIHEQKRTLNKLNGIYIHLNKSEDYLD